MITISKTPREFFIRVGTFYGEPTFFRFFNTRVRDVGRQRFNFEIVVCRALFEFSYHTDLGLLR